MLSQAEKLARSGAIKFATREDLANVAWDWRFWARPEQLEPEWDWTIWLAMAGRGFGKTRLGSEWVRSKVCGKTPLSGGKFGRVALVAETAADARDVVVEGPAGILRSHPSDFRPKYVKSGRKLEWPNGAVAFLYSAEEPDQLRGPEHDLAWSDELAKWDYAQDTWDMLQFGLRAGRRPLQLITTTPRPIPIVRELLKRENVDVAITRGSTFDNSSNLPGSFLEGMRRRYEGTRLGRQELNAEILDDAPGALWTREMLEVRSYHNPLGATMGRDEILPEMASVVVGVDPSGTKGDGEGDEVGIVVAGKGVDGRYYVLDDMTCSLGPAGWARRAIQAYDFHKADCIVAETNYGGAMVENTIRMVNMSVSFRNVVATRGKVVRAQPISALYEQGRVRHARTFPDLEDQLVNFTSSGYVGNHSPDRADASVWALTYLSSDDRYDPDMWRKLGDG